MAVEEYFGGKTTGGASFGQSAADLVSLHGVTPTSQDATIADVLSTVISTAATSSSPFGYGSAAQADAITDVIESLRTKVNSILLALEHKGIVASS